METLDTATAQGPTSFPYVPGLLTFREGPILLRAFARLTTRPDLIIFDGHGFAHPRRFGLASHLGYLLDIPSIGCAKSVLIGEYREPDWRAGSFAWLIHQGERIGAAVRTRDGRRPVYVSVGHRMGLANALRIVLSVVTKFRIPEPTRIADIMVERLKRERLARRFAANE
jgi:deoxyribonuclease V